MEVGRGEVTLSTDGGGGGGGSLDKNWIHLVRKDASVSTSMWTISDFGAASVGIERHSKKGWLVYEGRESVLDHLNFFVAVGRLLHLIMLGEKVGYSCAFPFFFLSPVLVPS